MTNQDLLYQIGFTLIRGIGNIIGRQILNTLGDASLIFQEKKHLLECIPGLSRRILAEIHHPEIFRRAERELLFIEKNKIKPYFITDEDYPFRLKDCVDAPLLFFFKGNADLNSGKIISLVGTRNATSYGKEIIDRLIQDIRQQFPDLLIVSGLAYGIDILAHRAALKEQLPTVAVLAHGLDRIYPPTHRNTAVEMLAHGGLLTDFLSETNPDRQNFVKRNRIIAGLADCTLVVESGAKGGSLITANIAASYNRDVYAFPGKVSDRYSQGCNALIKEQKGIMMCSAEDLFREMNWIGTKKVKPPVQRSLPLDLIGDERMILELLIQEGSVQLNTLCSRLGLPMHKLSALLFELEMKGMITCLPGGIYQIV